MVGKKEYLKIYNYLQKYNTDLFIDIKEEIFNKLKYLNKITNLMKHKYKKNTKGFYSLGDEVKKRYLI